MWNNANYGRVVRVVSCKARRPGSNPSNVWGKSYGDSLNIYAANLNSEVIGNRLKNSLTKYEPFDTATGCQTSFYLSFVTNFIEDKKSVHLKDCLIVFSSVWLMAATIKNWNFSWQFCFLSNKANDKIHHKSKKNKK